MGNPFPDLLHLVVAADGPGGGYGRGEDGCGGEQEEPDQQEGVAEQDKGGGGHPPA